MIDRLLAVRRARLVPRSVERAATSKRMPGAAQLRTLERDMLLARLSIEQVQEVRERLAEVNALPRRGGVL